MDNDDADTFDDHRRLLFTVAYGILGTAADAEDVVQDSWLRWSAADRADVVEPRAYLVQIATRVALNRLRTVRTQRETYVGPWLPEPILTDGGPEVRLETAEDLSMALLVVLETLSPRERAVFVLREVFGYSHAEVAAALDSSEDAVRQTAHRAREHVQARRPRYQPDHRTRVATFERFAEACASGEPDRLLQVLAPDVVFLSDGGGRVTAALRPVIGAEKVGRLLLAMAGMDVPDLRMEVREVNGQPAVVGWTGDGPFLVLQVEVVDGAVAEVLMIRNPDKLTGLVRSDAAT